MVCVCVSVKNKSICVKAHPCTFFVNEEIHVCMGKNVT